MSLQEFVYSTLDTDGRLLSTYLPRLCLDIRFATQVSPFVSQKILHKKHQVSLGAMVNSDHIQNALTEEDLPAEIDREQAFLK